MTKEDILKEVIAHDNDNLDEVKEEEDLEIVDEFFQCPIGSLFMPPGHVFYIWNV